MNCGRGEHLSCLNAQQKGRCLFLALDLNQDGQSEILALGAGAQSVYSLVDGKWKKVGQLQGTRFATPQQLRTFVEQSKFSAEPHV